MSFGKWLFVLVIAGGAYHAWAKQHRLDLANAAVVPTANGFVDVPGVVAIAPVTVTVFAAENCPHEGAQRADRMAEALRNEGIPVVRTSHAEFPNAKADDLDRINVIMGGDLPIVMINGRAKAKAKANPDIAAVIAEYKAERD